MQPDLFPDSWNLPKILIGRWQKGFLDMLLALSGLVYGTLSLKIIIFLVTLTVILQAT
jgi:hypothetical protein